MRNTKSINFMSYIENENICHKKITYVKPIAHHYEQPGEPEYIKYSCPICELLDNKHQVIKNIDKQCPLCNINLIWNEHPEEIFNKNGDKKYINRHVTLTNYEIKEIEV